MQDPNCGNKERKMKKWQKCQQNIRQEQKGREKDRRASGEILAMMRNAGNGEHKPWD